MRSPTISIITPSFNQAQYLREAIQSVAAQDCECSIEHVVVDGGSSDHTVEVLRNAPGVKWISEADRGQSHALNKALSMAEGDIIGWLNADDFYLSGALRLAIDTFSQHPDVDVVYGDCAFVDADGRLLRLKAEHDFSRFVLRYYGCFIPSASTFFRSSLLDSGVLRLLEDYHFVMDYELFMHLESRGVTMRWLPKPLAAFRWHEQNKSLDVERRFAERMTVQDLYSVWPRSAPARRLAYSMARGVHGFKKLSAGSLRRQREWDARKGEPLVSWMPGPS